MEEVSAQLKPIKDMLENVHDWQLSYWSNGSGRPLGFYQMRMKEDDRRNEQIKNDLKTQTDITSDIADYVRKEKEEKERWAKRWEFWLPIIKWAVPVLGTALLGTAAWIGAHALPVIGFLWQDYVKHHPEAEQINRK